MKNKFNLKTFPFDRQTISIKIIDDFQRIPNKIITESGLTYLAMDQIIKKNIDLLILTSLIYIK